MRVLVWAHNKTDGLINFCFLALCAGLDKHYLFIFVWNQLHGALLKGCEILFHFYKYLLVLGVAYSREVLLSKTYNDLNYDALKKGSGENNKDSDDIFPPGFVRASLPQNLSSLRLSQKEKGPVLFHEFQFAVSRGLRRGGWENCPTVWAGNPPFAVTRSPAGSTTQAAAAHSGRRPLCLESVSQLMLSTDCTPCDSDLRTGFFRNNVSPREAWSQENLQANALGNAKINCPIGKDPSLKVEFTLRMMCRELFI